jgi:acyl carrier protein
LLVALEEVLGVTIEPSEIERGDFDTPNKIINYVTNKANKNITAQRANN